MSNQEKIQAAISTAASEQRVCVEFVERGRVVLARDLVMSFGDRMITIPKGFESDAASVPAIFWPIVSHPLSGSSLKAALAHDYACRERFADSRTVHRWFYQRLRRDGCAGLRSITMYLAVRWFGPRWSI